MEEILERGQTWLSTNFDLELKLFFALSSPCVHSGSHCQTKIFKKVSHSRLEKGWIYSC